MTSSSPASAGCGTYRSSGANSNSAAATVAAETIPENRVTAPAWKLIAERESEPEPGRLWKKPPARLARPSAMIWRL